jgi:ABC-2 type transport system ATP-binding protein
VAGTGRTVIFATHNLEEADAYADRVLLLAEGRLVADGTANEIRAQVGGRRIRATLPVVEIGELQDLPGVAGVERRGEAVVMNCTDSDLALRALLDRYRQASDIEVTSAGLEEAFIELTASNSHEGR